MGGGGEGTPRGYLMVCIIHCIELLKGKEGAGKPHTKGGETLDLSNSVCIYVLCILNSAGDTGACGDEVGLRGPVKAPERAIEAR